MIEERRSVRGIKLGRQSMNKKILEIGSERKTKIFADVPCIRIFKRTFWRRSY